MRNSPGTTRSCLVMGSSTILYPSGGLYCSCAPSRALFDTGSVYWPNQYLLLSPPIGDVTLLVLLSGDDRCALRPAFDWWRSVVATGDDDVTVTLRDTSRWWALLPSGGRALWFVTSRLMTFALAGASSCVTTSTTSPSSSNTKQNKVVRISAKWGGWRRGGNRWRWFSVETRNIETAIQCRDTVFKNR